MVIKKLREYYLKLSSPAKASLWYMVCNVFQKGISLFSTPIFTRLLSTEEYGVYTVYQSWYSIIVIFATLYLYSGVYNNGIVKWPEKQDAFTSAMMGLTFFCTAVIMLVYVINPTFWNNVFDLTTPLIIAIFVQGVSTAAFQFWAKQQRFTYKFKGLVILTIGMSILSPVLAILMIVETTQYKAEARVLGFVLVNAAVGFYFIALFFRKNKHFYCKKYWRYAIAFSLPLIPHYLSQIVLSQVDRIMISEMVGKSEAGIYGLAYTVAMMMTIVTQAVNDSIIPYFYQRLKDRDMVSMKKVANTSVTLIAFGCCFAMLIAPEVIHLFASQDYYGAIGILPSIAAATFFMFLYTLYGDVEFYFEQTKFVMVASCMAAGLNVVLNYLFIPMFGYYAAGYTTLICYIVYALSHALFANKICQEKLGIKNIYDDKFIAVVSIMVLIIAVVSSFSYTFLALRIILIGIIAVSIVVMRKQIFLTILDVRKKQ